MIVITSSPTVSHSVPYALKREMETQVKDMLKKGVIEPSFSPWSAPAILVPKKSSDGRPNYRVCVDFRVLNQVTQFDSISQWWTIIVDFGIWN